MRDAVIIGVACVIAIVIGGWLFFLDSSEGVSASRPAEIMLVTEGQHAYEVTERKNYRIRSLDELRELWSMTYDPTGPAIPAIDFNTYEVLAMYDGTHTSGGYGVAVTAVEDSALSRTVHITRTSPGAECVAASVITSPFILVRVPASDLPIVRVEEEMVTPCD